MPEKIKRFYRWFKKPKTTVLILAALLLLYFVGLMIPQKVFFKSRVEYEAWIALSPYLHSFFDYMKLTEIYVAPITILFLAVFFLNLLVVTVDRIPVVLRKAYITGNATPDYTASDLERLKKVRTIDYVGQEKNELLSAIDDYFRKKGWFVAVNDRQGSLLAVKNRLSVLGFLMFHLSFFILLMGGLLIFYSRFSGNLTLTEGQVFESDIRQFHRIHRQPKILFELPPLGITLNKVTMVYEKGQPADLKVDIDVTHEGIEKRYVIGINKPIRLGDITMLSNNVGVSPLFILRNAKDGKEIDGAWVSLNVLKGHEDKFFFDKTGEYTFDTYFFPDYIVKDGMETSRGPEIVNPAFHVKVRENKIPVAEATIKMGQAMVFEPYMLEFAALRHWAEFQVVREFGPTPLIIGFAIAIVGLVMRLIFYRREVKIAVDDGKVYLMGTTQLYEHTFNEELDGIEEEIRKLVEMKGD